MTHTFHSLFQLNEVQQSTSQPTQEQLPSSAPSPSASSTAMSPSPSPSPSVIMLDSPATPRSIHQASVSSTAPISVFRSKADFISYLNEHPKSKQGMSEISSNIFSVNARRSITQVSVSKLIDVYGYSITSAVKEKVSSWLAELTQMKTSDYFDIKTHTGFLNKDIMNRRRKLPDAEKRWVWSKRTRQDSPNGTELDTSSGEPLASTSNNEQISIEVDGCPLLISDCPNCCGLCICNY